MTYKALETQEIFRRIYDDTTGSLRMSISGTVSGDLTITGDLTVQGSSTVETDENVTGTLTLNGDASGKNHFIINSSDGKEIFEVYEGGGTGGAIYVSDGGGTPFFKMHYSADSFINNGQNFGIGTDSPSSLLEVEGTSVPGELTISNSSEGIAAGVVLGKLSFKNYDSSNAGNYVGSVGQISSIADLTFGGGDQPEASLVFSVADGTTENPVVLVEAMRIKGDGNVGIGTSSPSYNLVVKDDSGASVVEIQAPDASNDAILRFAQAGNPVGYVGFDDTYNVLKINNSNGFSSVNHFCIDSTGNTGFGTNSPLSSIHIKATSPQIRLEDSDDSGTPYAKISGIHGNLYFQADEEDEIADSKIDFRVDGTNVMLIDSDGNVNISTTTAQLLLPQNNSASTPTLAFGDGDSGFYESADDTLQVSIAGPSQFKWDGGIVRAVTTGGSLLNEIASSTNPTLIPYAGDYDTGIGRAGSNVLSLIAGGANVFNVDTSGIYSGTSGGGRFNDRASTGTVPVFLPDFSDGNTGIGHNDDDELSLIAGGVEMMRLDANDDIIIPFAPIELGSIEFYQDSGMQTLVNLPVSSTPSSGEEMGYAMSVDSDVILKIHSLADGTGSVTEKAIIFHTEDDEVADGSLNASEATAYLDETANTLIFKVKYADGTTVKTGSIALS